MSITRREARELVDWVLREISRKQFPYITDSKLDLTKSMVGTISGTQTSGGPIADSAIWNRHVAPNADIQGTKVRIATIEERGTVELADHLESAAGLALQSDDPRLHDTVPSGSADHDVRYYTETELDNGQLDNRYRTETELQSTVSGFGASLIGLHDAEGEFVSDDVEAALHELVDFIASVAFIDLIDTPDNYINKFPQVPTINNAEVGLEWRPVDYYDGEDIAETYSDALPVRRGEEAIDAESASMNNILDGGEADGYYDVCGRPKTRIGSKDQIGKGNYTEFEADGTTRFVGDATTWEDLRTPTNQLKVHGVKPPVWTDYKGGQVLAFEDQAVNYQTVYFTWQMPHAYKLGTTVYPHVHATPEDATAGDVYWEFTYSIAEVDGIFQNPTIVNTVQAMPTIADQHKFHKIATIDGTEMPASGEDVSTVLVCSLTRRSDNVLDTFNGKSVYLLEVDLHYEIDTVGSRQELSK